VNSEIERTEIRVWAVNKDRLRLVEETPFGSERLEKDLERWLEKNPSLLGRELLVIGRQVSTTSGPLDLLALDELGALHIIELKRSKLPREVVAQALDYAAWLNSTSAEEITRIAEDYLKTPLDEAFQDRFDEQMPDITPQNHKILVVGTGLDAGAERLVGYLSQRQSIQINAVLFRYVSVGGEELLIRSLLVPESLAVSPGKRSRKRPIELLEMAKRRGVETLVRTLRTLSSASGSVTAEKEYVWEKASGAYDGSFRYWRADLGRKWKLVFGINVSEHWGAKDSELDVWIRPREIVQVTGLAEKRVRDTFAKFNIVRDESLDNRLVIRLRSETDASKFVKVLKKMFDDHPGSYRAES
jgi:hypothetical protein